MSRAMRLNENVFNRAMGEGVEFSHGYIKYRSHGYNRNSDGKILATRIDNGKQVWFQKLTPKQPRRIIEDNRMYKGASF